MRHGPLARAEIWINVLELDFYASRLNVVHGDLIFEEVTDSEIGASHCPNGETHAPAYTDD